MQYSICHYEWRFDEDYRASWHVMKYFLSCGAELNVRVPRLGTGPLTFRFTLYDALGMMYFTVVNKDFEAWIPRLASLGASLNAYPPEKCLLKIAVEDYELDVLEALVVAGARVTWPKACELRAFAVKTIEDEDNVGMLDAVARLYHLKRPSRILVIAYAKFKAKVTEKYVDEIYRAILPGDWRPETILRSPTETMVYERLAELAELEDQPQEPHIPSISSIRFQDESDDISQPPLQFREKQVYNISGRPKSPA